MRPLPRMGGTLVLLALGLAAGGQLEAEPTAPPPTLVVEQIIAGESSRRTFFQRLVGAEPTALLERPYAASWDGDDLVVTDPARGRVVRIDSRGRRERESPDGAFVGPIGVATCPWGVVVTDSRSGEVKLLDRDLRPLRRLAEGLERPTGVACDQEHIFVVETAAHRILVLRPEGGVAGIFGGRGTGDSQFNYPVALAIGNETLWVGDTLNFRLQRLSAENGAFVSAFGRLGDAPGETPRIKGIAVGPGGLLWVSDAHLDQIAIFRPTGELVAAVGEPGREPGQFAFPTAIALHPDGRAAVVDSLNRRIQILRIVGIDEGARP